MQTNTLIQSVSDIPQTLDTCIYRVDSFHSCIEEGIRLSLLDISSGFIVVFTS